MATTTNIGLHIYTDAELLQAFQTVRQWRLQMQGNNAAGSESDFQLIDAAIGDIRSKIGIVTLQGPAQSGTVTANEITELSKEVAIINYISTKFYKSDTYLESSKEYIDFVEAPTSVPYTDYVVVHTRVIKINKADGTWQVVSRVLSENYTKTGAENTFERKLLKFVSVVANDWVADNTYTDYSYKCVLTCTGISINSIVDVIFDVPEATSGDYAPVCITGTNTVTIFSKVNTSITIPTIKEV